MAGSFADTWNSAFEAIPADTENASLGANRIRDLKANVRQRLAIDHSMNGDSNDGKHLHADLMVQAAKPTLDPSDGAVYAKTVGTVTELFYEDSNGAESQLTSNGTLNVPPIMQIGTMMVFMQVTPPLHWIQFTNPALNDNLIRIVTDTATGGVLGGNWTITGLSDNSHVLALTEIPQHDHGIPNGTQVWVNVPGSGAILGSVGLSTKAWAQQGGNLGHSHGVVADGTWRPAYMNGILAYYEP